ncbi:hypothetical protein K7X08_034463 [Anisodus acutangulus]|uniref:Uncharacterized protein n=1 Tax=Anisodus acutangulus TaxID=402998 RepID=A0A9Q1LFF6_9SOLA|nr:hypothetical protein K7X08_034463 [Anisodus acutangulus]
MPSHCRRHPTWYRHRRRRNPRPASHLRNTVESARVRGREFQIRANASSGSRLRICPKQLGTLTEAVLRMEAQELQQLIQKKIGMRRDNQYAGQYNCKSISIHLCSLCFAIFETDYLNLFVICHVSEGKPLEGDVMNLQLHILSTNLVVDTRNR